MCGITGWVAFGNTPAYLPERKVLGKMNDAISHRGPDADGLFIDGRAGLAMRRLAIIDLSPKGNQPMTSASGRSTIVFNGEIYNFQELRERPELRGYPWRSGTDTETVMALYESHGEKCVEFLRGMFAFALWDAHRKVLLCARDRLGKKPLIYHHDAAKGLFLFGSELKAVLAHPALISRRIDEHSLRAYVRYGWVPAPRTIWREAKKLLPGHTLLLHQDGRMDIRQYWDVAFEPKTKLSRADATSEVRRLIEESVRLRLMSDVPLGAFLSGGIDSSAVVACMAKASATPVKTFSVGFDEGKYDELSYARLVAERYSTDHREIMLRPDFLKDLPKIMKSWDEPFADGSAIPTWYIARETRKHVTVALNGDGGDESFAGYGRYVRAMRARRVRLPPLPRTVLPRTGLMRAVEVLGMNGRARYHTLHMMLDPQRLFGTREPSVDDAFGTYYAKQRRPLDKWLYADIKTYLPDDLLVKADIATMAHSLEGRSPLLDHKLVEFAASLPPEWKLQGAKTKIIMREAMRDMIPREILEKPKQGFAVPINEWMRGELGSHAREELLTARSPILDSMDKTMIRKLFDQHARGADHGYRLWNLLMLREWEKQHAV